VTKVTALIVMNLVTLKVAVKHELFVQQTRPRIVSDEEKMFHNVGIRNKQKVTAVPVLDSQLSIQTIFNHRDTLSMF